MIFFLAERVKMQALIPRPEVCAGADQRQALSRFDANQDGRSR